MRKHDPEMKGVIDQAYDLVQKILRWRNMRLEKSLHIKYEPNKSASQSQLEAILADVVEPIQQVEEVLKLHYISDSLAAELPMIGVENIDLSWEEKDNIKVKADIEHKKRLKEQKEMQLHVETKNKR